MEELKAMLHDQDIPMHLWVESTRKIVYISPMIPINISRNPGRIENVYIGEECSHAEILEYTQLFKEFHDIFAWSYEEILGIDLHIVEHEINTYPNVKPV